MQGIKCTRKKKKIKQTTEVWRGKEDCYFKKVEKSELNMTGLHFVNVCMTSSAKKRKTSHTKTAKNKQNKQKTLS